MAQEVDQAAVDVIKTLLESNEGKRFFTQYLGQNLKLDIHSTSEAVTFDLIFNHQIITSKVRHKIDLGWHIKTK